MSRTKRKPIWVIQDTIFSYGLISNYYDEEWYRNQYLRYKRDGRASETSKSSGYKKDSVRCLRQYNRRLCKSILNGKYNDGLSYPSVKMTKHIAWNYW